MTAHCRKVRSLSAWTPVPGGRLYDIPLLYQRHCVVTGARRAWLIASYAGHEPRLNRRRYRRIASRAGPHHRERSIPILATHSDAQRDPRKDPAGAATRAFAAGEALRAAARYSGQKAAGGALALKSEPRRPATLGSSAAAGVRLIVWCRDCRHQVESDPAEQAQRLRRRNDRSRVAGPAGLLENAAAERSIWWLLGPSAGPSERKPFVPNDPLL